MFDSIQQENNSAIIVINKKGTPATIYLRKSDLSILTDIFSFSVKVLLTLVNNMNFLQTKYLISVSSFSLKITKLLL